MVGNLVVVLLYPLRPEFTITFARFDVLFDRSCIYAILSE